ncbi:Trafficking protein particle complex subunit 5 [Perkinsus chesapeaki]|uniref:Trafficking protein particle complex subunit 5 n=1 Tax=Perkinsus chesapeaki TaxID=330153 RepID=A0A7J6KXS1_PERCH|nr:Trafficking protein particle complex subunit 5 [Perkinsus chesapeaki]
MSDRKKSHRGGHSKAAIGGRDYCALTRPIVAGTSEVSQSAVSHLFCEMVCYAVRRQGPDNEHLETKLQRMGASLGPGLMELSYMRDTSRSASKKRDYKILPVLYHVANYLWKSLFGHEAEVLTTDQECEFYLADKEWCLNKFISLPPGSDSSDDNLVNCGAFAAGLVEGAIVSAGLACKCTAAYNSEDPEGEPMSITIIIDFDKSVIERQKRVAAGGSALYTAELELQLTFGEAAASCPPSDNSADELRKLPSKEYFIDRIDVDENRELARANSVGKLPCLIVEAPNGKMAKLEGLRSVEDIITVVDGLNGVKQDPMIS